jgi:hypothetical protein
MIFDRFGLPKDAGASDLQDSARAAGLCVLFGLHPEIDLSLYTNGKGQYWRHPSEFIYSMSRDQTICLFAGMWKQKLFHLVNPNYNTEGDLVSPAVRGHFRRCARLDSSWFQDAWLMADVYAHAWFTPTGESNQLISMMMVADPKFLRAWCKLNKHWRTSIQIYWYMGEGAWRGERELGEKMIKVIEEKIK